MIKTDFGRKLAWTYGLLFLVIFTGIYFYTSRAIEHRALAHLEESLTREANLMGHILTPIFIGRENPAQLAAFASQMGSELKGRVTVMDAAGAVLADSEVPLGKLGEVENHKARPEVRTAMRGGTGTDIHFSKTIRVRMLYIAVPLKKENEVAGVLRLALPLTTVNEILDSRARPVAAGLLVGIVFVLIVSLAISRSISERVGRLTDAAKSFAEGDLTRRISIRSGDELETLARTMTRMAATIRERIDEIEKEKAKFSAVLSYMAEAVIAVDTHNKILIVNPSAEKIFGIRRPTACGRGFIEVIRNKKIEELMAEAVEAQTLLSTEVEWPQVTGTKFLKASALGISKADGGVAGILVVSDVTEIRKLESSRREFVANVSHELRTPLTSVRGFIETLLGSAGSDAARRKEFLKMMEEDAERLTKLIDDLLELSRIEARQTVFQMEPLNLAEQVGRAAGLLKPGLEAGKIVFENRIRPEDGIRVVADPGALRQVLMNLLDNAIKFNEQGGRITINAVRSGGAAEICIEDTGCGIPASDLPRIFERFYRVDKDRSREMGGTGLGLAIVKHALEACGGTISCQSEPGKGSKFIFTLPLAPG